LHWQVDAQINRPDLIHTRPDLIHTRPDLIQKLGQISSTLGSSKVSQISSKGESCVERIGKVRFEKLKTKFFQIKTSLYFQQCNSCSGRIKDLFNKNIKVGNPSVLQHWKSASYVVLQWLDYKRRAGSFFYLYLLFTPPSPPTYYPVKNTQILIFIYALYVPLVIYNRSTYKKHKFYILYCTAWVHY